MKEEEEEEAARMDDLQGEQRSVQYCSARIVSPEIVEIGEESRSLDHQHQHQHHTNDVYVAVGKDDLDVVKWVLDHHVVSPSARVFLVHIFPPITYIPTPVGKLSRSQLSQDQVRVYINEESNRRRSLLQKYICLCADAKVTVETMLIEHDTITKAIVDLIPVVNITKLVIGTKHSPRARRLTKRLTKGEYVKRRAPDYCEVTIVYNGEKVSDIERVRELNHPFKAPSAPRTQVAHHIERKFFECACFSACRPKLKQIQECVGIRKEHHKSTAKHK